MGQGAEEELFLLSGLLDLWSEEENFNKIMANIFGQSDYQAMLTGLDGSARSYFMAGLALQCRRPALVIAPDQGRAEKIYTDLLSLYPGQVRLLPSREFIINTEVLSRSEEYQQMRLQFLEWLYGKNEGIYVATGPALLSKMLPPETWNELTLHFRPGRVLDRQELIDQLVARGYVRASLTEARGHFSARGDIIDIFPPGRDLPFRLELFDDIIQSLRTYDPETQRSTEKLDAVTVMPARELLTTREIFEQGEKLIQKRLDRVISSLRKRNENDAAARLKQEVSRHLDRLSQPEGLDFLSSYFPFFYNEGVSLIDYLSPDFLVFIDEPSAIAESGESFRREFENYCSSSLMEKEMLASTSQLLWQEDQIFLNLPCPLIGFSLFPGTSGIFKAREAFNLEAKSAPYYHGQWELFKSDYQNWLENGYRICLFASSAQRAQGLLDYLTEQGIFEGALPLPSVFEGSLEEGFIIPGLQLALVAEQNLLPRRQKKKRFKKSEGIRLSNYRDLSTGDYVVHEQHGIGKYQGLSTLEISGVKRDYLLLKYRGTDRLYIPVDQIGLIQKYSGGESPAPRLHSLGGGEWQRLKKKVSQSVEELARELLSLYAARQAVGGYSFSQDHPWQQEFETHFPYEETPDQQQAVNDVKVDLEKAHPMDRLICGDVGYGKTEVAMRAAFKVVMEGKQVAVLVPTTVLAQQHYRTFQERFEGFPIRVAQLSRFVSKQEQKEVVSDVAAGKVDLVIGTHRLLSGDISFNDLGLLVLDEEQRFGVRQKEKIRKMRLEVDTLAMTATPIPRTLHLSLAGARDLSVIDTPPEDRYPVQTYVLEYSEDLIREAVQRELKRDGQVFIVFNRVDQIDRFSEKIRNMFPDAAVAIGHGRMPETSLEKIMTDFQEGSYQILVCTTIIESGLDIPNVNTLIVCEADKFGLAQLYQIRGRVGRSNRLAYAYLTYRRDKVVSEVAQKRLKAVKEFTELGSGFKIALQDLEIRGAGNILGADQHGFITAVGFDMYCRLLDQAVAELKNEKEEQKTNPRIELQINAYLPSSYITAQAQKVDFYQRIYNADSVETLQEIEEELADRYGSGDDVVKNLLKAAELRIWAMALGVELIQQQGEVIYIQFNPAARLESSLVMKNTMIATGRITVKQDRPLTLKLTGFSKHNDRLNEMISFFTELNALQQTAAGSW